MKSSGVVPKIGDKIYGFCRIREKMVYVEVTDNDLGPDHIYGTGFVHTENYCGPISVSTIIPEEIVNSPLFKAMQELE